jgi:peroxiredoxin
VDLLAAVLVIGLAAWAVVARLRTAELQPPPGPSVLEVGEVVPADVVLEDLEGSPHRLGDLFGDRATVLYSWSTTCPCIPWCEDELKDIAERHGPEQGFRWVAVAGEPTDTVDGIRETMEKIGAFYDVLLDPSHLLCEPLGFDRAAVVAVLDRDGILRFRGNPSDRLKDPTRWFLNEVLDDVAAGSPPRIERTELTSGCEFSGPGT